MPLIHGQGISAGEIEREISSWDAVRFARLSNAVGWASTWRAAQTLPAFTERVIVADNGIDAEWQGEFGRVRAIERRVFLSSTPSCAEPDRGRPQDSGGVAGRVRPHLRHSFRLTLRPDGTHPGQLVFRPTRSRKMLWDGRRDICQIIVAVFNVN